MAVQIQGFGGSVGEVDGTTFRALRITPRPTEYGALGHFKVSTTTGSMAAGLAASSEIFQFRWSDATKLAVIQHVHLDGVIATTAFAVGQILLRLSVARTWTVDGSGGTTITLTGDNQAMRTSMGTSLATARIATTAALTAGTKTFDTQDAGQINTHSSAGTSGATPIIGSIYLPSIDLLDPDVDAGEHPLVLAQNEGFAIRATVPATGVWIAGITVRWAEATAY